MNLKKVSLTIGVAVLVALFIGFTIDAFYEEPKHEDFCDERFAKPRMIEGNDQCNYFYDSPEFNECVDAEGKVDYEYGDDNCPTKIVCDFCNKEFEEKRDAYNHRLLWITAPIGFVLILLGLFLGAEAISAGLLLGGILTLLQVTARSFSSLGKFTRVIVLGIELALLIWIGYKKVEKKKK